MKNKIKNMIMLLLGMLLLVSCIETVPPIQNTTHKINYYLNGEQIDLEPSSYQLGDSFTLPIPTEYLEENETFIGWYLNANYTGSIVTEIASGDNENKILFGKTEISTDAYQITYYLDGEQIDLEPSSYQLGDSFTLPIPTEYLEENETFIGWYLNANYTGSIVTEIASGDNENKILFGKTSVKEIPNTEPNLEKALNINNYSYTYEESDTTGTYTEEYKYANGTIANTYEDYYGDTYTDYLCEVNGIYRYVYEYDGTWYYTLEGEENFELYTPYMIEVLPSSLDASHFEYDHTNGYFYVKDDYLQTEADNLMGTYDGEVFKSFKIYLKGDLLDKIVITSDYTDSASTIEINYTITFTNINETKILVPDAIHDTDSVDSATAIEDVYNMPTGSVVSIEGTVTGIYGNNFFINDGTKGILVYCGNDTTFATLVEAGVSLNVTGSISSYKDVYQLQNITSISSSSKDFDVVSTQITDISQSNVENYVNDLVHLKNAKIVSLPTSYNLTGSDLSFVISLNNVEIDVFISKHVDSTTKNTLFAFLKTLNTGDLINIDNLHISKYNEYQFVTTQQTTIEKGFTGEIKQNGISLSTNTFAAIQGALKEEILGSINVYATYNDGSKKQLAVSEYTVVDDFVENKTGTYTFTYNNNGFSTTLTVSIITKEEALIIPEFDGTPLYEVLDTMGYDSTTNTTYGITKGLPSTGNPKVLVIPIEFTNALAPSTMVSDLEKAFFGTSEETGWESLQSYYYKSSYGKLTIEGTVLEPYNTGMSTTYYDKLQDEYNEALDAYLNYETDVYPDNVEYLIIKSALEYYDNQINYDDYDTDKDGYIDSIYLVYTRDYDDTNDESLWWAFTYEYYTEDIELYDNVEADFYIFMSYQFLFDKLQGKTVTYNTETIIHETGHLLGLDDYYDYDDTVGPNGGIGGGDMMDYNVGDHNSYSKMLLGWVTPYVTTSTTVTIDLNSFEKSGECIMICKNWNGSVFTEFYIIDFYTPTGLNEIGKGSSGLFSTSGIRIYHVDATLNNPEDCFSIYEVTKYNNSYTDHRLITLVEADANNDIDDNGYSENSDLFQVNNTYSNAKWYDNTKANFTLVVNSISNDKANITINF